MYRTAHSTMHGARHQYGREAADASAGAELWAGIRQVGCTAPHCVPCDSAAQYDSSLVDASQPTKQEPASPAQHACMARHPYRFRPLRCSTMRGLPLEAACCAGAAAAAAGTVTSSIHITPFARSTAAAAGSGRMSAHREGVDTTRHVHYTAGTSCNHARAQDAPPIIPTRRAAPSGSPPRLVSSHLCWVAAPAAPTPPAPTGWPQAVPPR